MDEGRPLTEEDTMRSIRSHLTYANLISTLCLILILGGGVAYAANTVFSGDIVDNQVYSADVRNDGLSGGGLAAQDLQAGSVGTSEVLNDTLSGGGLTASDLRSGSVGPSEAAGLGPADIANAASGSDSVNADKLDGLDSSGLVQGRGTLLSNRIVFLPGQEPRTLLEIPGLGRLFAQCTPAEADILWENNTQSTIDRWSELTQGWDSELERPGSMEFVATSEIAKGATLALGVGNDPDPRRIATVHAFAFQSEDGAPCGFQAQGTLWTSE